MLRLKSLLLLFMLPMWTLAAGTGDILPFIVPQPVSVLPGNGRFTLTGDVPVLVSTGGNEALRIAQFFADRLSLAGQPKRTVRETGKGERPSRSVIFEINPGNGKLPPEGYTLKITPNRILAEASSGAGLFHAVQTLFQLLPPAIAADKSDVLASPAEIPSLTVRDYPRYPYRGMHLDVSRHFFPKEFILRYIDLLAMYKFNTFHWHFTDDNGWRIEIKKYPELTKTSAWRADREDLPWDGRPPQRNNEKATYGGYYSQDEIREVVQYAADRYITVIPEIEMPAHCVAVLAAYPHLSCTGGPFTVPTGSYWPNIDIYCAGNDSVFTFLQDVLSEVMELFPSKYIHLGGDEADKTNWKTCPKCQTRMKQEGLKDVNELQSYFMKRMEKFVLSKGRRMIGWDEILEGGLAPEATVMSWRGLEGGIAAARQGHDAIMTPTNYCYFDYYQADPAFEPKAIGGFVTLKRVYDYEPTPEELTPEEARHILGAQGNVWTEFIPTTSHAEYMALPRMIALSEVVWSPKKLRNWDSFRSRLNLQFEFLDAMKVNYSKGSYRVQVNTKPDPKTGTVMLVLSSEQPGLKIRYTLDGNPVTATSTPYTGPVPISANGVLHAAIFDDNQQLKEKAVELPVIFHKAIGKKVTYTSRYSGRYPAGGDGGLTDGLRGSSNHRDGLWQGFLGNDLDLVIDLGSIQVVNSVQMNFLQNQRSWIFLPKVVEYSLSSDGKKYHSFNEVLNRISPKEKESILQPFNFQFMEPTKARYIHVKAKNPGVCPEWHDGAGQPCWIFTDEVVVF